MKKKIIRLTTMLVGILILTSTVGLFASCKQGVNLKKLEGDALADAIYDISAQDYLEDAVSETKDTMKGTLYGAVTDVESTIQAYAIGQKTDSPILHGDAEMVMNIKMGNITQTQERKHIQGYRDGKMYTHRDDDGEVVALVSNISYADFKTFDDSLSYNTPDELRTAFKSASVKHAEQKETGNWTAEFSGYTKESLKMLIRNRMDESVYLFEGYQPSDMKVSVEITEDHKPVGYVFELVFEKTDEKTENEMPTATTTVTVKDFGTATAPDVDFSDYKVVEDVRPLYTVQKCLGDYDMQNTLTFTSQSTGKVTYGGGLQKTEVVDVVRSEVKDGKYTFEIKENQSPDTKDEIEINMTYKNGRLNLSGDITNQSQAMTDNEARLTVDRLLDPASITGGLVSNIEAGKDGYDCVFTVHNPDYTQYEQGFAGLNAKNYKAEGTVSVKIQDGQVTEYRYDFKLTATVQGDTLTVETETVIRIGQTTAGEGSSAA